MRLEQQLPFQQVSPRAWEKALAWFILILSPLSYVGIAMVIFVHRQAFREAVESGAIHWYSFLIPLPQCIGAVLLVRMSRWSYPFLISHLLLALASSFFHRGAEALSSETIANFGLQALVVVFCSYLSRTGKLG